jgi:hypothetical protein
MVGFLVCFTKVCQYLYSPGGLQGLQTRVSLYCEFLKDVQFTDFTEMVSINCKSNG